MQEEVEDGAVLVDRSPQGLPLAVDRDEDFVAVLLVPGPRGTTALRVRVAMAELQAPPADGLVGDDHAPCSAPRPGASRDRLAGYRAAAKLAMMRSKGAA